MGCNTLTIAHSTHPKPLKIPHSPLLLSFPPLSLQLHRSISSSPEDNIFPVGGGNCSERYANFSGVWWDHGASSVATKFSSFFSAYAALGGKVDRFVLDAEMWLSVWPLFFNPGPSKACVEQRALAISSDARFPPIAAALSAQGLSWVNATSDPLYLLHTLENSTAYHIWDDWALHRTGFFFNESILSPLHAKFPSAQLSNYDYFLYNADASMCIPDLNGNTYCLPHFLRGALNGNVASPSLYMGFGPGLQDWWKRTFAGDTEEEEVKEVDEVEEEVKEVPSSLSSPPPPPPPPPPPSPLRQSSGASFPRTAWNALKWTVLQARSLQLALLASNRDVVWRPWFAYKAWGGGLANESAYWEEAVFHVALGGADGVLFWNPIEEQVNDASNQAMSAVLSTLNRVAGCAHRKWVYPPPPSTSNPHNSSLLFPANHSLLLTGLQLVNNTQSSHRLLPSPSTTQTLFRLTVAGEGQPGSTPTDRIISHSPLSFRVPPSSTDGIGASATCTLVFSADASFQQDSLVGAWITASSATLHCQ